MLASVLIQIENPWTLRELRTTMATAGVQILPVTSSFCHALIMSDLTKGAGGESASSSSRYQGR